VTGILMTALGAPETYDGLLSDAHEPTDATAGRP
jgi:hypothetical protein